MIEYGLEALGGGVMILKNPPPGGVMMVKTGWGMILENLAPEWGHVSEKSHRRAAARSDAEEQGARAGEP